MWLYWTIDKPPSWWMNWYHRWRSVCPGCRKAQTNCTRLPTKKSKNGPDSEFPTQIWGSTSIIPPHIRRPRRDSNPQPPDSKFRLVNSIPYIWCYRVRLPPHMGAISSINPIVSMNFFPVAVKLLSKSVKFDPWKRGILSPMAPFIYRPDGSWHREQINDRHVLFSPRLHRFALCAWVKMHAIRFILALSGSSTGSLFSIWWWLLATENISLWMVQVLSPWHHFFLFSWIFAMIMETTIIIRTNTIKTISENHMPTSYGCLVLLLITASLVIVIPIRSTRFVRWVRNCLNLFKGSCDFCSHLTETRIRIWLKCAAPHSSPLNGEFLFNRNVPYHPSNSLEGMTNLVS